MYELKKEEMKNIEGGANPIIIGSIVVMVVSFITGILYGYANPKECNK